MHRKTWISYNEPDWLTHSHGVDPETDKAVGAKAAMLGTFVNNAIERT